MGARGGGRETGRGGGREGFTWPQPPSINQGYFIICTVVTSQPPMTDARAFRPFFSPVYMPNQQAH